mmetsp:Transcript_48003/g.115165  ORF Transcript_48003/g.115165 Transcript_48003/m.115165 type:complete len:370 (+) Transcript_48003:58-1167(+)
MSASLAIFLVLAQFCTTSAFAPILLSHPEAAARARHCAFWSGGWGANTAEALMRRRGARDERSRLLLMQAPGVAKLRRAENAPGNVFVDESCIDCGTCRWMSPCFTRSNDKSAVTVQPQSEEERLGALQAMVACPTGSIRTESPDPLSKQATLSFPLPVPGLSNVYHLGYHSPKSYGAAAYLLVREGGNVLVDSPRFNEALAKGIIALGGAKYMYMTHIDDVADHVRWSERLGCTRVMHASEAPRAGLSPGEGSVVLEGVGPWELDSGLRVIFQPGHTRGHTVLLDKEEGVLFTGDHLQKSSRLGFLAAFRRYCWHSWDDQIQSMEGLWKESGGFRAVLPGHGQRLLCTSEQEMEGHLKRCIEWMKEVA